MQMSWDGVAGRGEVRGAGPEPAPRGGEGGALAGEWQVCTRVSVRITLCEGAGPWG